MTMQSIADAIGEYAQNDVDPRTDTIVVVPNHAWPTLTFPLRSPVQ